MIGLFSELFVSRVGEFMTRYTFTPHLWTLYHNITSTEAE